jgi:hypothetical protein
MFNTKNIAVTEANVPSYWVFQFYLNLNEKLSGQNVTLKSIFNPTEKTPSMTLYVDKSVMQYKFKDFSTGKQGSKIDLVKYLFNLNYSEAVEKIIADYNKYGKEELNVNIIPESNWKIENVKTRSWNNKDAKYWTQFNIGSNLLNEYNVKPLEHYTMTKEENSTLKRIIIEKPYLYGYFSKEGEPYKIYQPYNKDYKFLKITSYLQGFDQLKFNKPYLVICSSLKDGLSLKGFKYNIEIVAPDSENSLIKPYIIENLKLKYESIITLFDNDKPGIDAIKKYHDTYSINGCYLSLSKDVSDSIKDYGYERTNNELKKLLKETFKK